MMIGTKEIWDLDVFEDVDPTDNWEFMNIYSEFVDSLDELDGVMLESVDDDFFVEDMKYAGKDIGLGNKIIGAFDGLPKDGTIRRSLRNTKDTVKAGGKIYKDITDAGGELGYQGVKAGLNVGKLLAKIIAGLMKLLSYIPRFFNFLADKISKGVKSVSNLVKGRADLWITAPDLAKFNQIVLPNIKIFLDNAKTFTDGDGWTDSMFNNNYKEMERKNVKLRTITYEKSTIELKQHQNFNIYFDVESDYWKGLKAAVEFFNSEKRRLEEIYKNLENKYAISGQGDAAKKFAKLSNSNKRKAAESLSMVSNFATVIGRFLQYVLDDMKTLNNATSKAMKYDKKLLQNAVKRGNVKLVRTIIRDSLIADPTTKHYNELKEVAFGMEGLFEKDNGNRGTGVSEKNVTRESLIEFGNVLTANFSEEKLELFIKLINALEAKKNNG